MCGVRAAAGECGPPAPSPSSRRKPGSTAMQSVIAIALHRMLPAGWLETRGRRGTPDGIQTAIRNACYVCEKKSFRKVLTHSPDI